MQSLRSLKIDIPSKCRTQVLKDVSIEDCMIHSHKPFENPAKLVVHQQIRAQSISHFSAHKRFILSVLTRV